MNPFFNSILTGIKQFFGMPHDATEAEVDAKIQSVKSHEELVAQVRAEVLADRSTDEEYLKIKADLEAATARAVELEANVQGLNTALETAKLATTALETELATAKAEITRLEKLPAAEHTNGEGAPPGGNNEKKPWLDSPANAKIRAMAEGMKMKLPQPT